MERFNEGYSLRSILNEAEEDPNETNTAPEDGADEGEGDPNAGEEDAEDENTETEEDGGDSTDESPEDSESEGIEDTEDEDFNIDAEDDTEDEEADIDGDEDSSDDINSDSEEEIDADSLKALDGKLYDDLSPAEQKLKIRHLKELYTNLFYKCAKISEKLNSVFVEDDNVTLQIKMAGSTLFNLKQMISDYFLNIFDSKSYQENDIMFNRYLAMLNEVKLLTDELKKMYFNDSE